MKVLIIQSNYIPWKGYFDNIAKADIFIVYDNVQYTRQDWRNRNIIKTKSGLKWITIPIMAKDCLLKKINETYPATSDWKEKHLRQLHENYAKANCYKEMTGWVKELYTTIEDENLSAINQHFLKAICKFLKINTPFVDVNKFEAKGNATEKLVDICLQLGCKTYITGPNSKNYLEENLFFEKGINIEYADYGGYPEYPQLNPPFEHGVSILDLIFNCGDRSASYLKNTTTDTF